MTVSFNGEVSVFWIVLGGVFAYCCWALYKDEINRELSFVSGKELTEKIKSENRAFEFMGEFTFEEDVMIVFAKETFFSNILNGGDLWGPNNKWVYRSSAGVGGEMIHMSIDKESVGVGFSDDVKLRFTGFSCDDWEYKVSEVEEIPEQHRDVVREAIGGIPGISANVGIETITEGETIIIKGDAVPRSGSEIVLDGPSRWYDDREKALRSRSQLLNLWRVGMVVGVMIVLFGLGLRVVGLY